MWASLREISLGYMATFSDRLVVQKAAQADLAETGGVPREYSEMFAKELRAWVAERSGPATSSTTP